MTNSTHAASDELPSQAIAIVGMAGRFPGARTVDQFWRNVRDGVESITRFSDAELLAAGVDPAVLASPDYVKAGAVLEDVDKFDAAFFGLTPREAELLDPQQRVFLEVAWDVLESAGYDASRYRGSIGVFAGGGLSTYLLNNLVLNRRLWEAVGPLPIVLGNDKDSLTTRVAYLLDLVGPCYAVQTYCSTSLVAVSVACENLLSGVCDMAIAGGVMISVPHRVGYTYLEGGIASPDGRCRAFDAKAKGSPLGNGAAAVLLKRLEDALADGDTIHAVIRGWAVNNDGALRAGFTAPGVRGQAGVILEALASAGVSADDISYVETHGTGTALGDAIEFAAMVKAFREQTDASGFCAVGSVKTNVGHLDRAAGATSLIKAAMALEHGLLPPSLNYDEPNPQIDFNSTPFVVNTRLREWPSAPDRPRRAGVSSFGMGGTNAHVVLEEAPPASIATDACPNRPELLLLSARTSSALDNMCVNLAAYLTEHPEVPLADAAHTLQVGRKSFEHRRMLVTDDRADAIQALSELDPSRIVSSQASDCDASCEGHGIGALVAACVEGSLSREGALQQLGRVWLAGHRVDWAAVRGEDRRRRVPLPTYPFERRRYWIDPEPPLPSAGARSEGTAKKADPANWFYESVWVAEQASPTAAPACATGGAWLVLQDARGCGSRLIEDLRLRGEKVFSARQAATFTEFGEHEFGVRLDSLADYQALLRQLQRTAQLPTHIVHLWSLDDDGAKPGGSGAFHRAQQVGFYSLLHLAQALGELSAQSELRISVVTDGLQPVDGPPLHPAHAPLASLTRVIPQENPNARSQLIDVRLPSDPHGMRSLIDQLLVELLADSTDPSVAFRGDTRYVERFQQRRVGQGQVPLREGGVYMITGGLGGVGLTLAEHLARDYRARLVLTSRSGLPPCEEWDVWLASHSSDDATSRTLQRLRAMEAAGAEIMVAAAAVDDHEQMRVIVSAIYDRFGALHGVIHAAGLTSLSVFQAVQNTDRALCEAHFRAKVDGLFVLEEVLRGKPLDFCLAFSSLSTVLGGLGFAGYAAANHFMDRYIQTRRVLLPGTWISVSWDAWQVGDQSLSGSMAETAMNADEGVRAFRLALTGGAAHLVHSTADLHARLRRWVQLDDLTESSALPAGHARPNLPTAYVAASDDVDQRVARVWQEVLGIDEVGIHDNFFDLGGNSLIGLQVVARLQKEFNVPLSAVALFEAPTVSTFAARVRPRPQAGEDLELAALVDRRKRTRQQVDTDGIAIVGMTGRFPGAGSVDQFWQNLCQGKESIAFFSDEELLAEGLDPHQISQPNYVKARPVLDGADQFDAGFFGFSPREAELLDPQHRLFLECSWEALELAGYDPLSYKGLIGVFAGANISSYLLNWLSDAELARSVNMFQAVVGSDKDSLPTTVSYKLNLRGPSLAVQTFCSTSLVATHMACRSLLDGECDMALAGGVSIRVPRKQGHLYQEGGQESPDGHCRTFDARAAGSLFGDGVGVVVLKRLQDALDDGDTVHAVIKGSAVNNDGSLKVGYTAPSVAGQAEAVAGALERAGVHPETIGYVEAHGTATPIGDPIEVAALTRVFRRSTDRIGYCAIGSVKTNMGHLDRAAGVTGLIKAALAVKQGVIPANLHYEKPNPQIDFASSPFFVNDRLVEWRRPESHPRRAGVNSLGMGGTNAHVVVEEPAEVAPSGPSRPWLPVLLSARSSAALEAATTNLTEYLRQHPEANLADVAYTLAVGRHGFAHRRVVVGQDSADVLRALEAGDARRVLTNVQPDVSRPIAFMFPGVGDHYVGMARELYEQEPVFRDALEQCCRTLYGFLGIKLRDLLYSENAPATPSRDGHDGIDLRAMLGRNGRANSAAQTGPLSQTAVAQPVLFAVEYALAQLLMSWGLHPRAMVGYSLGEYVAACLAGVFSLEDGLRLVAERARMIQALPAGAMLAIGLPEETLRPVLPDDVSLAIHVGAAMSVVAGSPQAIARLQHRLAQEQVVYRPIETTHAFHSSMLEPVVERLTSLASNIRLNPPQIPYLSNVSGTWISQEQATDPAYWAEHMCGTVRFHAALNELLDDPERIVLEVGPGQSLCSFVKQHPRCAPEQFALVQPTLRHAFDNQSDVAFLLGTLGKVWLVGGQPAWSNVYGAERRQRLPLPTYPFERQRYWLSPRKAGPSILDATPDIRPGGELSALPRQAAEDWFYLPAWKQTGPIPPQFAADANESWLVFADSASGLDQRIAEALRDERRSVAIVEQGAELRRHDPDHYVIRPGVRDDYETLLHDLQSRGRPPTRIVHLWNVTPPAGQDTLEQSLEHGLHSLMWLAQLLGELDLPDCQISVVSSDVQEVTGHESLRSEAATVIGACRVVPIEYPHIKCRSIDLALAPGQSSAPDHLLRNLLGELTSPVDDRLIALRGHQRWVQVFEPLRLPAPEVRPRVELRRRGTYLITGGLGGIGLAVAEHLARTVQARLVLIGRTGLPPRVEWPLLLARPGHDDRLVQQIRQVLSLEAEGAEVLVVAADVADVAQLRAVVELARHQFGPLHGVFHAAGVPGMGLIQRKTPELVAKVLRPKVLGTLALEQVLAGLDLDFLALFSSITAVTGGGPGQIDYCAANAFLDAYALRHVGEKRLTVAIDWAEWQWNAWAEGLAGFQPAVQAFFRENRERFGITFAEGCVALERALALGLPRVVVSPQDFRQFAELSTHFTVDTIREWGRAPRSDRPRHQRPSVSTSFVKPRDDTEQRIAAIWSDILGIEEIGTDDNFFELGGNSLIGLDLIARIRRDLETESLPAHILYEAPTVSALADHLKRGAGRHNALNDQLKQRGERRREALSQRGVRRPAT